MPYGRRRVTTRSLYKRNVFTVTMKNRGFATSRGSRKSYIYVGDRPRLRPRNPKTSLLHEYEEGHDNVFYRHLERKKKRRNGDPYCLHHRRRCFRWPCLRPPRHAWLASWPFPPGVRRPLPYSRFPTLDLSIFFISPEIFQDFRLDFYFLISFTGLMIS